MDHLPTRLLAIYMSFLGFMAVGAAIDIATRLIADHYFQAFGFGIFLALTGSALFFIGIFQFFDPEEKLAKKILSHI